MKYYNDSFGNLEWLEIRIEKAYAESAHHNYVLKLDRRDELNAYLKGKVYQPGCITCQITYMACIATLEPAWRLRSAYGAGWSHYLCFPV